jgi:magnesium transporter
MNECGESYTVNMINRFQHQGVQWVDLESPTPEEVEEIAQEFELGNLLPQDLLGPSLKPRADVYPHFTYAVLHFPATRHTRGENRTQEVDFVIGNKFIITAHYDTVPAVYDFARSFEADTLLKHASNPKYRSGHVLLELSERLYQTVENELESLEDSIAAIEHEIFEGKEREMVVALSVVSRELLNQKRTLSAHKDVLDALEQVTIMTLGEEYGNFLRGMKSFHARVYTKALSLADVLTELRETNSALLYTRQNEIMKNLTIMAFITFPLSVIAALFGMNTANTPILGTQNDFWIILGGMAILTSVFFIYFKARKWF